MRPANASVLPAPRFEMLSEKGARGTRREMPEGTGVLSAKFKTDGGTKREIRGTRRAIQKPQGY